MTAHPQTAESAVVRYGTPLSRWVLTATVLGSGIAFLDGAVVTVALRAIGADFHGADFTMAYLQSDRAGPVRRPPMRRM